MVGRSWVNLVWTRLQYKGIGGCPPTHAMKSNHVESLFVAYLIQYRGRTNTLLWHVKLSSAPVYGFLEPPRPGGGTRVESHDSSAGRGGRGGGEESQSGLEVVSVETKADWGWIHIWDKKDQQQSIPI